MRLISRFRREDESTETEPTCPNLQLRGRWRGKSSWWEERDKPWGGAKTPGGRGKLWGGACRTSRVVFALKNESLVSVFCFCFCVRVYRVRFAGRQGGLSLVLFALVSCFETAIVQEWKLHAAVYVEALNLTEIPVPGW